MVLAISFPLMLRRLGHFKVNCLEAQCRKPITSLLTPIAASFRQHRFSGMAPPVTPLPSSAELLDSSQKIEEERFPNYVAERYYPVRLGGIFDSRYQVITKLGFGAASTIWLCRDIQEQRYLTLKVHVRSRKPCPEVELAAYLNKIEDIHGGEKYVRRVVRSSSITGPHGVHPCLLYEPTGIDISNFIHQLDGGALPETMLRMTARFMLIALDYLHQLDIIHTDIQPNNILAPEVILDMEWDNKIDIWGLAQTIWTLFECGHLFDNSDPAGELDPNRRFAEMVSLLGPPPPEFLRRSKASLKYWDEDGNWKSSFPIPTQTLESREVQLEGKNKELFLHFMRKMLCWLPEERATASQLLFEDEWVRGGEC
ncbi:predicted protein [Uncinocarpus reesii 1704]|uniref:non-specific serine/threonine protein kinase n=1 Tax=Uncinocarpus reesii (strain UAMH 1704) TaxID=336963 RepID=C4JMX3_UNCRE|nr:uncharacterized protein UREG_04181 [Uncinocarpus reesii 1704]EEP79335.1 predicted protein [Uncinocarpus reesii 1704]